MATCVPDHVARDPFGGPRPELPCPPDPQVRKHPARPSQSLLDSWGRQPSHHYQGFFVTPQQITDKAASSVDTHRRYTGGRQELMERWTVAA
jgi:hypothetical protein